MPRARAEATGAILTVYPQKLLELNACEKALEGANRFWKRPAFWIPVACVTFTVGLGLGVWSK